LAVENELDKIQPPQEAASRTFLRNPIVLVTGAIILAAAVYFLLVKSPAPSSTPQAHLPFGPQEQAYVPKLEFGKFAMSRAENFLHQEVTIISGDVLNTGDRTIRAGEITITFQDDMNQIVLRDTRPLFAPQTPPLAPGKSYHFEISFDHIPPSWNVQVPSVRVTGLQFAASR
jgi:hypothetical protein